jgi:hypothetical protein
MYNKANKDILFMNNKSICFFAGLLLFLSAGNALGQCKSFTKKKCMPDLMPYVHNGQMNTINLFPGETATLKVAFYSGQDYRIISCAHPILKEVYFQVKTSDGNVVYNSKDKKSQVWDLKVVSTQELTIDVFAEKEDAPNSMAQSGCVAVLVGFKP